jgi:hypothetical protein
MHAFLVILSIHNAIAGELSAKLILVLLVLGSPPLLDDTEHETTTIGGTVLAHVALGGVVEDTVDYSIDCSLGVDALVVPAGDELGDDPFEDLGGDFASWFVEDLWLLACRFGEGQWVYVGEMVFG